MSLISDSTVTNNKEKQLNDLVKSKESINIQKNQVNTINTLPKQFEDLIETEESENVQKNQVNTINTLPKQFEDLIETEESENVQKNQVNIIDIVSKQSGGTNNNVLTITNFEDTSETQCVLTDLQRGVNKLYTYLSKKLIK